MTRYTITALMLSLLAAGCKHPLDMIGEGDILSASGNRDCLYEQAQADDPACTDNQVNAPDAYVETYYAVARPGWHFHRWANFCKHNPTSECSWNISAAAVAQAGNASLWSQLAIFRQDVITGYNSLFMGHSLFDPVALGMEAQATQAGFTDHSQTALFWPAQNGSPINIWNNPTRKAAVTDILDQRDVALFGMAIYHDILDIEGYRLWAQYAIQKNPDIRIFIGLPWEWYPDLTTAAAYETSWDAYHPAAVHTLIDQLRAEFPYTDFFCIPYGQAGVELYKLYDQGLLVSDVDELVSDTESSIFLDSRGHPNSILTALSELVWLNAIYGVDMTTYPYDPGYNADLKAIADSISLGHDPNYNAPYLNP